MSKRKILRKVEPPHKFILESSMIYKDAPTDLCREDLDKKALCEISTTYGALVQKTTVEKRIQIFNLPHKKFIQKTWQTRKYKKGTILQNICKRRGNKAVLPKQWKQRPTTSDGLSDLDSNWTNGGTNRNEGSRA